MTWFNFVEHNNWGAITFTNGGVVLTPDVVELELRWPDGSIKSHRIVWKSEWYHVSDHGNHTDVSNLIPHVEIHYRGAKLLQRLGKLPVLAK